jgi:hypothetical protein
VRNKQDLFDNVVNEDASEDVIGVSKKLLDTLVENLAGPAAATEPATEAEPVAPPEAQPAAAASPPPPAADSTTLAIRQCIEALQQALGPRIERCARPGRQRGRPAG